MKKELVYSLHVMLRGIILIGLFLLVFKLLITGDIHRFIAPKMIPFQYFTIVVLLILGFMQIWRSGSKSIEELYCNCGFDHNQNGSFFQGLFIYSLFILPVLTGLIFPNHVLDSSVVAKRGVKYGSGVSAEQPADSDKPDTSLAEEYLEDPEGYMKRLDEKIERDSSNPNDEIDSDEIGSAAENGQGMIMTSDDEEQLKAELLNSDKIIVDEKRYLAILDILYENLDLFSGKEMEIVGFVYKEPDFGDDQFVVARFGVSCCVADASVYGIFSAIDPSRSVKEDDWVKVTGILTTTMLQEQEIPHLQINEVEQVEQPENPYVYEILKPLVE